MTVVPGQKGTAGIAEVPDPGTQDGALLVRGMAVGICGTDRETAEDGYGTPPSGEARLVIDHESLGEVVEAPAGSGFATGDLVVGIVRRPDPVPCPACAAGEWDVHATLPREVYPLAVGRPLGSELGRDGPARVRAV